MKIDLKQPKYVIPLLILPFLCFFFYLWQSNEEKKGTANVKQEGLQNNIGEASAEVRKKQLSDKLDAYRNTYKESDGYTAVVPIQNEQASGPALQSAYNLMEQRRLDSIDQAMKIKFPASRNSGKSDHYVSGFKNMGPRASSISKEDKALADALSGLTRQQGNYKPSTQRSTSKVEKDPMELFKTQMAYMDSVSKSNDPEYKAELAKKATQAKIQQLRKSQPLIAVKKAERNSDGFNTVLPEKQQALITAIIDENVTGYADSRIRIRLLEDINAGKTLIRKGTYLYAFINGFTGQRVNLAVQSILIGDKILPVKLSVYDQDGQPGLYVPSSAFREFTKDLSGNTMQGMQIQGNTSTGSQFLMSTFDKVFQSTSSAIASAIRKNKAKIKYNSHIYLIDQQALQNASSKL
jgi:conjugative transposon TraM protein